MRRSRLYLTLSVVSLLVAFGIGLAEKRCRYKPCSSEHQTRSERRQATPPVWEAFYARDFDRMNEQATLLIDSERPIEGHRLRAYALRGQKRYDEAAELYTEVILMCSNARAGNTASVDARHDDRMRQCESYIGRAHVWHMLGSKERAAEDIDTAHVLARDLLKAQRGEDEHYMLACAYAVQSAMLSGQAAHKARLAAIGQLQLAVEKGFNSWQHARADMDLDTLRLEPGFIELFPKP